MVCGVVRFLLIPYPIYRKIWPGQSDGWKKINPSTLTSTSSHHSLPEAQTVSLIVPKLSFDILWISSRCFHALHSFYYQSETIIGVINIHLKIASNTTEFHRDTFLQLISGRFWS